MDRLIPVGKIAPKSALEVKSSQLGIGFEKLDRNVFDPEKAYDKVAALGVKWVRLQSGWQRTEREKGVYNFAWLDDIVDNLIRRGMVPWICLCYGNDLYTEAAKTFFGAVGCPPIFTEEERAAWHNYVKATTEHFKGRVEYYEVWNEPDGSGCWKHGVNAQEYGEFAAATAKAAREGDESAKIIGGVTCSCNWGLSFISDALAAGMGGAVDALSYHRYTPDEFYAQRDARALRALCDLYNPDIELIQGESGTQSSSKGAGALRGGAWTPWKQAKYLLRHRIADFQCGLKFTSHFTAVDMIEALNGTVGDKQSYLDYGYFGVLSADFDENGFSTGDYSPKPAYYALQNLASVFAEDFKAADLPIMFLPRQSPRMLDMDFKEKSLMWAGFKRDNGAAAFAYWNSADLMTTDFESTVTLDLCSMKGDIHLIDLMDGTIYDIPESMIEPVRSTTIRLKNIPIKDYPLLLTIGDFAQ